MIVTECKNCKKFFECKLFKERDKQKPCVFFEERAKDSVSKVKMQ